MLAPSASAQASSKLDGTHRRGTPLVQAARGSESWSYEPDELPVASLGLLPAALVGVHAANQRPFALVILSRRFPRLLISAFLMPAL